MQKHSYKVLPSDTKEGKMQGHEITAHKPDWMSGWVSHVVFERFDAETQMPVEVVIHWTRWTQYVHRASTGGHGVVAVILDNGQRIHAKSWFANYGSDIAYNAAPIHARGNFKITTLDGGWKLLEVEGVESYLYSKRDEEARAKYLSCPWERDNAEFRKRFPATA